MKQHTLPWKTAWITGASSGIGRQLAVDLAGHGVKVQVINPGFVRTPMTDANDFPMPFMLETEDASQRIIAGLASGRFEIVFPKRLAVIMKLLRLLPYGIYFRLMSRFVQRD